jgi:hypothetical protein
MLDREQYQRDDQGNGNDRDLVYLPAVGKVALPALRK